MSRSMHFRTKSRRKTSFKRSGGQKVSGYAPVSGAKVTTTTPSQTDIETETSPGRSYSVPQPSFTGTAGTVMLASTALIVFATWNVFWSPLLQALWVDLPGSSKNPPPIQWKPELLGFLTIGVLTVVASTSPEVGGLVLLIVIAMWVVFLIFNQSALQGFLGWFSSNQHSILGGGASGTFGGSPGTVTGSGAKPPVSVYPPNQH